MLGVDERADAATPLRLGHDVVDERRLAGCLGPEDLDDAAAGQAADAERDVERERAGRDRPDGYLRAVAHPHHRALPELSLDLTERDVERFLATHPFILPRSNSPTTRTRFRVPRTAPLTGAGVKGKQPPRTERSARCSGKRRARAGSLPETEDGDVRKPRTAFALVRRRAPPDRSARARRAASPRRSDRRGRACRPISSRGSGRARASNGSVAAASRSAPTIGSSSARGSAEERERDVEALAAPTAREVSLAPAHELGRASSGSRARGRAGAGHRSRR